MNTNSRIVKCHKSFYQQNIEQVGIIKNNISKIDTDNLRGGIFTPENKKPQLIKKYQYQWIRLINF